MFCFAADAVEGDERLDEQEEWDDDDDDVLVDDGFVDIELDFVDSLERLSW